MNRSQIAVFVRYALMILAGRLASGGWLPEETASELAYDPVVIEVLTALVVGVAGIAWYLISRSRKALVSLLDAEK